MAQPDSAIGCLWYLMTLIPAGVAAAAAIIACFYPLTTEAVNDIVTKLRIRRKKFNESTTTEDEATDFANVL